LLLVGVDGSDIAHRAFNLGMRLRRPEDEIAVMHISDANKTYLPSDLKPEFIRNDYESTLIGSVPTSHVRVDTTLSFLSHHSPDSY
jgi:hypothetical protein